MAGARSILRGTLLPVRISGLAEFGRRRTRDRRLALAAAAALFGVALALRVPFRTALAYHWDGAEFALAVREFNVALSQPHAPGYFLYVMLGRWVHTVVADPHAALVWVSVVAGSLLVPVMYGLGAALFDRRTGWVAALLALTSPQLWFHSEVALTYVVDALLVCLTMWWCWQSWARGGRWMDAVGLGALLAVTGGVRPQTVPALLPVVLFTAWHWDRPRFAKLLVTGATAVVLALAWLWPTVQWSGGWELYREVVRRHTAFNVSATFAGGGWGALGWNIFLVVLFTANGLMLATGLLVGGVLYRDWITLDRRQVQLLGWWLVPMLAFGTVFGFTKQPGYVLSYLPALLLLAAAAAGQLRGLVFTGVVGVVCLVNVTAFAVWDDGLLTTARTAAKLRDHDARLAGAVAAVRARFDPAETVVLHAGEYLDYGRVQFQWHLSEFFHLQLAPDPTLVTPPGRPLVAAQDGRTVFVTGLAAAGHRRRLLVVPPRRTLDIFQPYLGPVTARPVAGSGGLVFEVTGP